LLSLEVIDRGSEIVPVSVSFWQYADLAAKNDMQIKILAINLLALFKHPAMSHSVSLVIVN